MSFGRDGIKWKSDFLWDFELEMKMIGLLLMRPEEVILLEQLDFAQNWLAEL